MTNKLKKKKNRISRGERLWRITVTVLGVVFLWCMITFLVTPFFMTHPHSNPKAEALIETMSSVRSISIKGRRELSGYLLDDPGSDTLLIYYYGISDDAASCMLDFIEIKETEEAYSSVDIAVVDWPSYGKSKGFCSDIAMEESACDVVRFFTDGDAPDYACSQVVIMGYSLGTGPAVYAAAKCGCSDLILLSPYYSSADLYNNVTPIFYGPLKSLLGFNIETFKHASDVNASALVIACSDDQRVPFSSSERLTGCFLEGCDLQVLTGIDHGQIPHAPEVLQLIGERLSAY